MSDDEIGILFVLGCAGGAAWLVILIGLFAPWRCRVPLSVRWAGLLGPVVAMGGLVVVLTHFAAADVVNDEAYILYYFGLGAAWLGLALSLTPLLGLSLRDDVAERGNGAALTTWTGAAIGVGACFAGANIGDGPGWWCVLWAAGLATAALFVMWAILWRGSAVMEAISIERDRAAGLRLGALLGAAGLIAGRGAAGDWSGFFPTVVEFTQAAWPLLPMLVLALLLERRWRPTAERPVGDQWRQGVVPAGLWMACVLLAWWLAGPLPVVGAR